MPAIITCGELLIDFISTVSGVRLADAPAFEKAAGGAPANVAVGLARLGHEAGYLGQVGQDEFGRFLVSTLTSNGVDTSQVQYSEQARTPLAFVSLTANGERDFMFYRHQSADQLWELRDQDRGYAASCRLFHFGSLSLSTEPSRGSTLAAVNAAAGSGALISYDPNLRVPLWPSSRAARDGIMAGWGLADVIKVNDDELRFLTDETDIERGARRLFHDRLRLLVVTRGAEGCLWFSPRDSGATPGFDVGAIDTTGAGDGFMAGLLSGLLSAGLDQDWEAKTLGQVCRFGNAVGALTTTRRGAIPALPARAEVEQFLTRYGPA